MKRFAQLLALRYDMAHTRHSYHQDLQLLHEQFQSGDNGFWNRHLISGGGLRRGAEPEGRLSANRMRHPESCGARSSSLRADDRHSRNEAAILWLALHAEFRSHPISCGLLHDHHHRGTGIASSLPVSASARSGPHDIMRQSLHRPHRQRSQDRHHHRHPHASETRILF